MRVGGLGVGGLGVGACYVCSGKSQEVWSVTERRFDASASGVLCPIPASVQE